MRMYGNVRLIVILVLGMVVFASVGVQVVGAAGEVTWHLRRDSATGFDYPSGHQYNLIMTKESPTFDNAKWFKIDPGNELWRYTNYSAECNLTFPAGEWNVTFLTQLDNTSDKGKSVEIHLWRLFENGTATEIINKSEVVDIKGERWHTILLAPNTIDVDEGERIALSFKWTFDAAGGVSIGCDGKTLFEGKARDSTLKSPPNSPAYPVPELPTLILFSTGLIALAGYVLLTKRRRK